MYLLFRFPRARTREVPARSKGEELQGGERASERSRRPVEVEDGPAYGIDKAPFGVRAVPQRAMRDVGMDDDAEMRKFVQGLGSREDLALYTMR